MRQLLWAKLLVLGMVLLLTACAPAGGQDNPEAPVLGAFESALHFVQDKYGERAPDAAAEWQSRPLLPGEAEGEGGYMFLGGQWLASISRRVDAEGTAGYAVRMWRQDTGFEWQGLVAPGGAVTEVESAAPPGEAICVDEATGASMTYERALRIAGESECAQGATFAESHFCHKGTGFWLINLEMDAPGCMPVCEVSIRHGDAAINWQCTGIDSGDDP